MSSELDGGVLIKVDTSYIRLCGQNESHAGDAMLSASIEARAGPFHGAFTDHTIFSMKEFIADLQSLYDQNMGRAALSSYDGFNIDFEGDGRGGIKVKVYLVGSGTSNSNLSFEMMIDQTYLPTIIHDLKREFS